MIYELPPLKTKQRQYKCSPLYFGIWNCIDTNTRGFPSKSVGLSTLSVVGWIPSTFVSSRNQKGERQTLNPEDFMDEEVSGYQFVQCAIDGII